MGHQQKGSRRAYHFRFFQRKRTLATTGSAGRTVEGRPHPRLERRLGLVQVIGHSAVRDQIGRGPCCGPCGAADCSREGCDSIAVAPPTCLSWTGERSLSAWEALRSGRLHWALRNLIFDGLRDGISCPPLPSCLEKTTIRACRLYATPLHSGTIFSQNWPPNFGWVV